MKTNYWKRACVIAAACMLAMPFAAEDKKPDAKPEAKVDAAAGDEAWADVLKAMRPPPPPAEWSTTPPTEAQISAWEKKNGLLVGQIAEKTREFYTKFPDHSKAELAHRRELELLTLALRLGNTNCQTLLAALEEKRLSDPAVPEDEKIALRAQRIVSLLRDDEATNRVPVLEKAEKQTRALLADFPKREEAYELLSVLAQEHLDAENLAKARALAEEITKSVTGEAKERAGTMVRKIDRVGRPFEMKFTDLEGHEASMAKLAGHVVLIDFWATWCPPCRAALPELKETYAKLHAKGFDVLGVSLDNDRDTLTKFLAEEKMSWPQFFDTAGRENKFAAEFEITGIPTMWLVDKQGRLRDLNGGRNLPSKVEKLLLEK